MRSGHEYSHITVAEGAHILLVMNTDNPHPEVAYVTQITNWIRVFTRTRVRLIWIGIQVKA